MKTIYIFLITLIFSITAESKDMKIIFFYETVHPNSDGKIIYMNHIEQLRKINYENTKENYRWSYSDPIFFGKNYLVVKYYRYWAKKPYYDDYSIQILDENFNFKEELFKVHNKNIDNIAYNPSKKIITFSVVEKDEKDDWINKKTFLNLYDLANKRIILSKEMGQYLDDLHFTTRAFNSNGELICLEKNITETKTKGNVTSYKEKGSNIVIYDILNDKEIIIDEGSEASFVTDNLIMYRNKNIRSLYIYNLTTKKKEKYFSCSLKDIIANYFISPDNKQIIIVFNDRFIVGRASRMILYDFETKKEIKWDLLKEIESDLHIDWQFVD